MSTHLRVQIEQGPEGGARVSARMELDFSRGPVVVLFGPSGAGKTTLLRCLAGLEWPRVGRIEFGGEVWHDSRTGVRVRPQRRGVGYVAQDLSLFPHLSARRNVAYALRGTAPAPRVEEMLAFVGLSGLGDRLPSELSGGERQRLAIARALAAHPRLVLLDEPLSSLDAPSRARFRDELRGLLVRSGTPAIVVTHDRDEALVLGDQVAVMLGGEVVQYGQVLEVFSRPATPEIAAATGIETIVEGTIVATTELLSRVAVGGREVTAVNTDGLTGNVYVCIRAQDVTLIRDVQSSTPTTARTRLHGVVRSVRPGAPLTRVTVDCGFGLEALITGESCEEMGISEGVAVVALVKAPNVHLVPRASP